MSVAPMLSLDESRINPDKKAAAKSTHRSLSRAWALPQADRGFARRPRASVPYE
jgi:hypothetical protein